MFLPQFWVLYHCVAALSFNCHFLSTVHLMNFVTYGKVLIMALQSLHLCVVISGHNVSYEVSLTNYDLLWDIAAISKWPFKYYWFITYYTPLKMLRQFTYHSIKCLAVLALSNCVCSLSKVQGIVFSRPEPQYSYSSLISAVFSSDSSKTHTSRVAASSFGIAVMENTVFLSKATNFVTYFRSSMHYPSAKAANMVTNFMGTLFLLTIFVSDSFLTRFWTFLLFGTVELLGLVMLTIQAFNKSLHLEAGKKLSQLHKAVLFVGLYAMATGVGVVTASLQAHSADQLDNNNKRLISRFFNWYFFCLCSDGLLSSTVMVWVEDNKGWTSSFCINIAAFFVALCIFTSGFSFYRNKRPAGSPLTRSAKVLGYASRYRQESSVTVMNNHQYDGRPNRKFRYLEKAVVCGAPSSAEFEETRTFLGLLPIFASTIMMNCCLATTNLHCAPGSNHGQTASRQPYNAYPIFICHSSINYACLDLLI